MIQNRAFSSPNHLSYSNKYTSETSYYDSNLDLDFNILLKCSTLKNKKVSMNEKSDKVKKVFSPLCDKKIDTNKTENIHNEDHTNIDDDIKVIHVNEKLNRLQSSIDKKDYNTDSSCSSQSIKSNEKDNDPDKDISSSSEKTRSYTGPGRLLPETPTRQVSTDLMIRKNKLFRTNSEPIPSTKPKTRKKSPLLKIDLQKLSKRYIHDKNSKGADIREEPIFPNENELKKYESAVQRGRRGAVISLDIDQSVSYVKLFPGKDTFAQFKFLSQNSPSFINHS